MKSINYLWLAVLSTVLAACVVAVPLPGNQSAPVSTTESSDPSSASSCDSNNPVVTDMSEGTHKVTLEDSCQLAKVTIVNENTEHAKKCNVYFGSKGVELYIPVGETRIVSQNKPIKPSQVTYGCRNDWNKPK